MARALRYNPPPNWPPPPPGWTPPAGWAPDPAWGPPPPDWPLWVRYQANPTAFGRAFLVAGVWWLIGIILVLAISRGQGDIGFLIGASIPGPIIAAVVTALIARSRPRHWSIWMYILWVFVIGLVLRLITTAGQLHS